MSVRVSGLRVAYGDREVLGGVDLEAADGEFLGLTGPSGCGKTTLLHAVAGLLPAEEGAVSVDRRELAYVFQKPMLLPWRTTLENASFGLECRGVPGEQARSLALELLARTGLSGFAGHYPHQLSEGMKQRLNLARAMLVKPKVVLLDEPFSALDARSRRELQDLLLEFWRKERFTVLFVSHWTEELAYLADRVAVFSECPSRAVKTVPIALARPRGQGPEGRQGLLDAAEACR